MAAPTNRLVNPGFETGSFFGWTVGGNSAREGVGLDGAPINGESPFFQPAFVNVRSGNYAGWGLIRNPDIPGQQIMRLLLSQMIEVLPNTNVDVGFWLGNDSAASFGTQVAIDQLQIYADGAPLLPCCDSPNVNLGSSPSHFANFATSFNTGPRTSVLITYAINGSGNAIAGASFDDFYFVTEPVLEPVPEPYAMALVVFGSASGMLMFRRRNRTA
jgi:hypothetical protein